MQVIIGAKHSPSDLVLYANRVLQDRPFSS
jgi:hypothetical protein